MCDQYNHFEVRVSDNGKYYTYDNELYDIHFPIEYAKNHLDVSGPKKCMNCADYGSWRGVFIGYCANCADIYNFERGNGMLWNGIENQGHPEKSIFNTYLKDVDLEDVGDIEMNPSHIITDMNIDDIYNENDDGDQLYIMDDEDETNDIIYTEAMINDDYNSDSNTDIQEIEYEIDYMDIVNPEAKIIDDMDIDV